MLTSVKYQATYPYPDKLKEKGKIGNKFAKPCANTEDWTHYTYENKFPFNG